MTDAEFAAQCAAQAGRLLVTLRAESGLQGKQLGRLADAQSNQLLLALLASGRPDDAVLSEESADTPARLSADRVWIIDPLDGTREYGIADRTDWAVHVALWERGAAGTGLTAGAVAQPALEVVYSSATVRAVTATSIAEPATAATATATTARARPRLLVSDSRPPAFADSVAEAIGGVVCPMGSAGAKAMAVVRGEADAYLHAGGQWEWDSAAPVAVALAAGLYASRIYGSALTYNTDHAYLPDLLICRPALAAGILTAVADAVGAAVCGASAGPSAPLTREDPCTT